ncbi:unnamed protein product [Aureobasidium vineae]|uniref:Uncharacterized protein n=1 Tax=Aureobasidium vineae TaxID=2773715 RepID=A0A9N8PCE6_9PEZI|nr:unnamed protein product [Aureobasidium vineae]
MLTVAALSSLILSLATAAAIKEPQQLLVDPEAMDPAVGQADFKKFAIEDMSDAKFRLHHHAAKTLLSDQSYLVLREGEIERRQSEIWNYLWSLGLDCGYWPDGETEGSQEEPVRVYMSSGRIFDADPERVPQDAVVALQNLTEQEHKNRRDMRRRQMCNFDQSDNDNDKKSSSDDDGSVRVPEPTWKVTVPDEYMQYLIPDSVLDEENQKIENCWREKAEKEKKDILAGKKSVRDLKMPDLSKCKKFENHMLYQTT